MRHVQDLLRSAATADPGPVVAVDQWETCGAAFVVRPHWEHTILFVDDGQGGWYNVAAGGADYVQADWYDIFTDPAKPTMPSIVGLTGVGADVDLDESTENGVFVVAKGGLAAPWVEAIRVESSASERTLLLSDLQVSELAGVFVTVDLVPYRVVPLSADRTVLPGSYEVPTSTSRLRDRQERLRSTGTAATVKRRGYRLT